MCECGDDACFRRLTISRRDYDELRAEPTQFAVAVGHDAPWIERIVAQRGNYVAVEKRLGPTADVAAHRSRRYL